MRVRPKEYHSSSKMSKDGCFGYAWLVLESPKMEQRSLATCDRIGRGSRKQPRLVVRKNEGLCDFAFFSPKSELWDGHSLLP